MRCISRKERKDRKGFEAFAFFADAGVRHIAVFCTGVALSHAAFAKPNDALLRMLNSKASGSAAGYETAAQEVADMAEKGDPASARTAIARNLVAVASRENGAPRCVAINRATREKYLESTNLIQRLALEKDNGLAWYLLAIETGDTNQILRAVARKNPQALNAWGTYLTTAAFDGPSQEEGAGMLSRAQQCFKDAAAQGDANGMYNLGMCLSRGLGGTVDREGAFNCFRSAAESGHPEAINNVGYYFMNGIVVEKDPETAKRWYKKSSDQKNPYGMFNYATILRDEGRDEEAVRLFRESALADCVEAMAVYGEMLRDGKGVPEDKPHAFIMFKRAAECGYPAAMDLLADCYEKGVGVKADERKSTLWHIRARAERGDRSARIWLRENDRRK